MPVNDVSNAAASAALPWWVTGAQPPSGSPTPPGYGGMGWLDYLASMFNPVGAAQAADEPQIAALKAAAAAQANGQTQPQDARLAAAAALNGGPPPQPVYNPLSGGSANTGLPYQPTQPPAYVGSGAMAFPRNPTGPLAGAPASVAGTPASTPAVNPAATGGASAQGAMSNPRFVQVDRPNADVIGRNTNPQGTALNLAGLFGGRGAPGAQPSPAGPLAKGGRTYPGDDWSIDAAGNVVPSFGSLGGAPGRQDMSPAELAAAIKKPNWWQSLGRPDMTPAQLAATVKKPNWYRNL